MQADLEGVDQVTGDPYEACADQFLTIAGGEAEGVARGLLAPLVQSPADQHRVVVDAVAAGHVRDQARRFVQQFVVACLPVDVIPLDVSRAWSRRQL